MSYAALKDKVKIQYTELPVLTDPQKALDPSAPIIHPETGSNLIVHHPLRKGDIDSGFAASEEIIEETYTTQIIEHAYIEPECVLARVDQGRKIMHVIGSIQNPFTTRRLVSAVLGWPLTRVRIEQAELGGSFGGKDDTMNILAARAAVGALKTGRPVKISYPREESILESYKRHPYVLNYRVGFKHDGTIVAMKIDLLADGGAYTSTSPFVTWRSVVQATGPYEIANVSTDVRAVFTNNPYTGAMRGFGSPQIIFAQESLMDEIAIRCGISPVEIRKRNGYKSGSVTTTGQKLENHDVNLIKVLETASQKTNFESVWRHHFSENKDIMAPIAEDQLIRSSDQFFENKDIIRQGIGLALSFRGCSLGAEGIDAAAAYLAVQPDGSVNLLCGLAENGQGLRTTFSIIAAEILGIHINSVCYLEMDTGKVPDSGPTVASRATLMGGSAVRNAANDIKERLSDLLKSHWELAADATIIYRDNTVSAPKADKKISFNELCALAYGSGVNLSTIGWYSGPSVHWDEETGQGPAYFTYVYGCQVAEVDVNIGTGEVFIKKITAVHDPGKVINLLGARGQVYGGVAQGAGYAILEQISTRDGQIRELNFDQYLIPTSCDVGEIDAVFVEGKDQYGPWGAKSLGEPTLELTAVCRSQCHKKCGGKTIL